MKENTKRTLVWLYKAGEVVPTFTKTQISIAAPALTSAGLASLLYLLEKRQLVESYQLSGTTLYRLTHYGNRLVESQIPALSTDRHQWNGQWTVVVGIKAPKSDQNFRYLREQLVSMQLISLTRGVFLYPGEKLPTNLQHTIETLYPHAVAVLSATQWQWGDVMAIIGHKIDITSLVGSYSGISSEVNRLIATNKTKKEIDHQSKIEIVSLFDRLYANLQIDFGLGKHFFPQEKFGRELLADIQLLG